MRDEQERLPNALLIASMISRSSVCAAEKVQRSALLDLELWTGHGKNSELILGCLPQFPCIQIK
jgi:hypothetical protein